MPPEELLDWVQKRPFVPFRIHLTDGHSYDVRHPELCMPGRRTAIIGLVGGSSEPLYERAVTVSLPHLVRLEPLEPAGTSQVAGS